jgi:hypothetical protein
VPTIFVRSSANTASHTSLQSKIKQTPRSSFVIFSLHQLEACSTMTSSFSNFQPVLFTRARIYHNTLFHIFHPPTQTLLEARRNGENDLSFTCDSPSSSDKYHKSVSDSG